MKKLKINDGRKDIA